MEDIVVIGSMRGALLHPCTRHSAYPVVDLFIDLFIYLLIYLSKEDYGGGGIK